MNGSVSRSGLSEVTPASNTGVEVASGECGVGWLGFTVWTADGAAAVAEVGVLLGSELRARSMATKGYTHAWDILGASTVSVHAERAGEVHLEITQTDCESLGGAALRGLVTWAAGQLKWKCSRLDLNYDDRARVVEPRDVYAAWKAGDRVTHVRGASMWESSSGGATCYVGSKSSDQLVRVYDAAVVHGPGYGVRWEWQGRNGAASEMLAIWFALGDHPVLDAAGAVAAYWSLVRRFCDFRAADSAEHVEDRALLPWWERLVNGVARMRARRVDVVPASFARAATWLRRQVAPTLAMVQDEIERSGHGGREFIDSLIAYGQWRVSERDRAAWSAGFAVGVA